MAAAKQPGSFWATKSAPARGNACMALASWRQALCLRPTLHQSIAGFLLALVLTVFACQTAVLCLCLQRILAIAFWM